MKKRILIILMICISMSLKAQLNWQQITISDDLPSEKVYALFEDSKQNVWAGTPKGILKIKPDGSKATYPNDFGIFNEFYEDKSGNLYAYVSGAMYWFSGETWEKLALDGNLETLINTFVEDKAGNIWAMSSEAVYKIQKNKILAFTKKDGIPSFKDGSIYNGSLLVLENGTLLCIGNKNGYSSYDGNTWTAYKTINDNKWSYNAKLLIDGKCYIATQSGVFSTNDGKFEKHDFNNSLIDETKISHMSMAKGKMYILSNNKAFINKAGVWEPVLPESEFTSMFKDKIGGIFLVKAGKKTIYISASGEIFNMDADLQSAILLHAEPNGDMVFTNLKAKLAKELLLLNNGVVKAFENPKPFYHSSMKFVNVGANDEYWISNSLKGLLHIKEGNIELVDTDNGMPTKVVYSVLGAKDYLWVGTNKGLLKLKY